jgi:hypothetical protein
MVRGGNHQGSSPIFDGNHTKTPSTTENVSIKNNISFESHEQKLADYVGDMYRLGSHQAGTPPKRRNGIT